MESSTHNESVDQITRSQSHGMEVGRNVDSMGFSGLTALEVKVQGKAEAGDISRNGNVGTVTSIGNGPRIVNKTEAGTVTGSQKPVGAKVGTWILNPNALKKLGIESSVMSALSKQRKATAANPAPIGSIVQMKSPPKPTSNAMESSAKTVSLNSQINSNFNQKILSRQPKKFQILSDVVLTEPILDVSGKTLPPEIIKQSIVHIQPQIQPKNNFMSNPTPSALICSRPPTLESHKLPSMTEPISKESQPTPGPSRDAFVFKPEAFSLLCSQSSVLQTPNTLPIHSSPIPQIAEISEVIPGTSKKSFMPYEPKVNILSSTPQLPSTSRSYDVHQPIPMASFSGSLDRSTRKSPPTITKDGSGLGVANASQPVRKLLNDKLRAKLDLQRSPMQLPDHIVPMNRPAPTRSYGSSQTLQKKITVSSNSTTNIIDSEIKLEPCALNEIAPRFEASACSSNYESFVACESVKVKAESQKKPLSTSDDTTTCTQPVSDAPQQMVPLSPAKTTATPVPKIPNSAPTPTISPSTSPELLGFRRQDLRYSGSLLKKFTAAQAYRPPNKRGKQPIKNTQPTSHICSTGSQTGDESTIEVDSLFPNVHTTEEVVASPTKVLATMKLDPDEADDEISDIESQKTTKIDKIEKTTLAAPIVVEIKETGPAPKVANVKGKYRRIKAIPVPVVRKRGVVPASVEAVPTAQGEASIHSSESTRLTDSVDLKVEQEESLTPLESAVAINNKETETERQIKTKKMQAMLIERTSLQSHTSSVPLPHKFTTPSERPRTAVKHYATTSDDDSSEAKTHSRPQRPKRQFRKAATSIEKSPNTKEMSEYNNINIEELNDRSDVLAEQVAECFTARPKSSSPLESTSSATSDVDNSFVKYLAGLSASVDRSEREQDKYAEVLMKNETVEPDIATSVVPEGKDEIAESESVENSTWMADSVENSMQEHSERQDNQSTEFGQIEESLEAELQSDIASAAPTIKDDDISERESFENVDWMANNTSDEEDVKPCISTSRKKPKPSIVSLLAERLDRDTLMADILKAEYSRFITISSDESNDEVNEMEVHQILGPVEPVVANDDEQNKATDDSTDFIIPISERDSGIVTEDNMEPDPITIDLRASEFEYVITELAHEETVKAEKSLLNLDMQIYVPVSDEQTDIVIETVQESDLVLDEPCSVDNELVDDSSSEFVEDTLNIKDETQVILMESEVQTTVEIATTGEDAEDVSEQNAVYLAWSLGVSNQIQSTSYDTMLNSSSESVEERFVVYEPTCIEVEHGSWEENNVTTSQDAVEVSTVLEETEMSDQLVDHTNKEKVSEKSSKTREILMVESEEIQEKRLLEMGQQTSTITVDCHEQPTSMEAAIGDIEVTNIIEDSAAVLQEVIQEQLPEIKKSVMKKRISVKPRKVPRKKALVKLLAEESTTFIQDEPKIIQSVQKHSVTHIEDVPMVEEPPTISYFDEQPKLSKTSSKTSSPVKAPNTEEELEPRPVSSITTTPRNRSSAKKTLHIENSDDSFVPKTRLLSKDSVSSDDMLLGRPNRSRAHIIDSDDERAAKTEVKKEEANMEQPEITVTHSELPAPLLSKRKRTVKSYADFFTADNPTHNIDDTPPAKRVRRTVNNDEIDVVAPRPKRGRKAKVPETPINTDEQSSNSTTEIPSEQPVDIKIPEESKPTPKRGRPFKVSATPTNAAEPMSPSDEAPKPKRGRRSKIAATPTSPTEEKSTPKRIVGRKTAEKPTDPSLPPIVTCGNCKQEMESSKWNAHVAHHYGLAWLDGIETAVDMNINNSKANKIMTYMKVHKMNSLKCHNCPDVKRSAIGYLSHLEVCGLTKEQRKEMMYQCPYCPSELRKVSIQSHNEYCAGLRQQRLLEKEEALAQLPPAETDDNVETEYSFRPTMRQSAKKAIRSFKSIIEDFVERPEDCIRRFNTVTGIQYKNWSIEMEVQGFMKCPEADCDYQTIVRKEMSKHYKECMSKNDSRYYCGRCSAAPDTYTAMLDHVKSAHALRTRKHNNIFDDSGSEADVGKESSDSDGPSGDEEVETDGDPEFDAEDEYEHKHKRRSSHKSNPAIENGPDRLVLESHANSLKGYSGSCFFKPAIEWTQDYREAHHFTTCAYPFALPIRIRVLTTDEALPYLPTSQQSPQYCLQAVNNYNKTRIPQQWFRLGTFASISDEDSYIIYAGGPVQLLEWLPLPDSYTESQLLAIVCKRDASERIYNNPKQPSVCCTLQIWNIDRLQNPVCDRAGKVGGVPRLLYNVAYDDGPTMSFAFCPSGGYTDDRLGLVALPTHDGDVRIMALPKNFTCDSSGQAPVLRLEPSLVLTSGRDRKANEQITKIAWSKAKGHHIIVAGYANGMVIVWRLNNMDSPLIRMEVDGVRTLLPVRVFYSGTEIIKLIDMHHDMHGATRWLIIGGHDHKVKFYDLQGSESEITVAQMKSRVTGGYWPLHWTSFISSIDDTYSLYTAGIGIRQPLDLGTRTTMINTSIGPTQDVAYSDWLHASIFVTGYGDIRVSYFQQFISGFIEMQRRRKAILGYTDTVEIHKVTPAEQADAAATIETDVPIIEDIKPVLEANASQSSTNTENVPDSNTERGIIFYDLMTPVPSIDIQATKQRVFPPPLVNNVRINKITMNANSNAYKWYAIGYELGFVRIKCLVPMIIPKQDGRSCR